MVILIVAENYAQYREYRKTQFPYYPMEKAIDRDFQYIDPKNIEVAMGLQRGNVYIHLSGGLPDWFVQRFTRLEIKDSPRHHTFAAHIF